MSGAVSESSTMTDNTPTSPVADPITEVTEKATKVNVTKKPNKRTPRITSSSKSKKRTCPDPEVNAPNSKRSKEPSPTALPAKVPSPTSESLRPSHESVARVDKNSWQGFCEIESEPAYFSTILREMGVQDITVREVFTMDPFYLQESLPQPIYGLILVFQYREFGKADQPAECPSDVWFANQLPAQNSCATLAMINILMNSAEVGIGEHLDQFKDFTRSLTPFQRGETLASFDFVKKIHNSFAKEMDILECDKHISHKVNKSRLLAKKNTETTKKKGKRGTKSRRFSEDSTATDASAETHEDNAHHFIAFVPVGNEVWKLDGLDAQPTSMGTFNSVHGETWLSAVSDIIAALMAAGDDDYGVIALSQSPLLPLRQEACVATNTISHIDARLAALDTNRGSFLLPTGNNEQPLPSDLGLATHLALHPVPPSLQTQLSTKLLPDLLTRRATLVAELNGLAASILTEIQTVAEEERKANMRRFDAGPVIKKWLEMLAENGYLEEHLERFMPERGGKKGKVKVK